MCITYEYDCRYVAEDADKATTENVGDDNDSRPPKRASYEGTNIRESRASSAAGTDFRGPAAAPQESPVETGERYPRAKSPPGIFDEYKSRYAGASAAMAFPHVLGAALGSSTAPKMSPFAYNFGLRPEEASHLPHGGSLAQLIGEDDLAVYSAIYFHSLAPIGDLLDSKTYAKRCHDYYHDVGGGVNRLTFGAIAAGVAALGSFLSRNRHPREADLVRYTKTILDDPMSMRMLCIDHVVAWGMRVLYLRATSRPNNAWIASCTLMHLVEAIGLHKEENIAKMASLPMSNALGYDADRMRRIFWIGWAGHAMISYEYDRTSVSFRDVTCRAINPKPGSFADQFVQIVQIIPAPNSSTEELCECITKLDGLAALHPFLVVTKADLAFCFYRRIYQLKMGMPNDIIQLVIDSGNAAVKAAEQLASQGRMFWNVIGSVFQYTCVLLAIDTPASSVHVAAAFASLEGLVKAADTQPTREALSMARHLLRLGTERKRRELALLEAVEMAYDLPPQPQVGLSAVLPDVALQMDWDQFLVEPYLTMLGLDAPM